MPLDAICLRAVLHELRPQLIGARIDKVQQPARDQIVLLLRGNLRLLLNAGANQPRIQLTNILRDNPAQPPMFCMLLRKHLVGARVLSIEQPDLERMVILTLQCTDEFGEISRKQLVLECMGRRSNLVLLDAQGRIVECLRRVDADLSATRQLLPGLFYHLPTPLDKLSLLSQEEDSLALAQRGGDAEQAVDKWVLDHYTGISPLIAREFAFRAGHETDVRFGALNDAQRGALVQEFSDTANAVKEDNYMPVILYRDGKPVDFTYRSIAQYGAETQVETRESFSQMLDEFYDARERQELSARRGRELIPAPETARVDGLFYISTIVPTPDGYGTFDTGDCRVEGYPDSEAAAALRSAMSEISVQRYYRLPTSLFSRFTQNWNYATIWWIPEDGQKHDLYLNWDEGFIYDDANRAVAYKIDGDAQQVFSELCAVISEYGTYTR